MVLIYLTLNITIDNSSVKGDVYVEHMLKFSQCLTLKYAIIKYAGIIDGLCLKLT